MSGSTGNMAFGASEKPDRGQVFISLHMAQRMLPLVQRIVQDVLMYERILVGLHPEQDRLDRKRRHLAWPERQRRYQIREEILATEAALREALEELLNLGVALLDPEMGRIGFPTLVNDRQAYFSWRPGEEEIRSWHFAGETVCRPIPNSWLRETSLTGKQ